MHLSGVTLHSVDIIIVCLVCNYAVNSVEVVVAVADETVKRSIDRCDFAICRANIPLPDIAVLVRETLDRVYQVALQVGQQCEVAAVKSATFEHCIDSDTQLQYVVIGLDCLLLVNSRAGLFVETRGGKQRGCDCCNQRKNAYIIEKSSHSRLEC